MCVYNIYICISSRVCVCDINIKRVAKLNRIDLNNNKKEEKKIRSRFVTR